MYAFKKFSVICFYIYEELLSNFLEKSSNFRQLLRWLNPVFLGRYHPTLKLSGIPTFTLILSEV